MRLDPKQIYELALPLADERLGYYQQDALCALRAALGNNQAGLDRLSEANFVRENAAAFAKTAKSEYYRINLVWIRINPRLTLRGGYTSHKFWGLRALYRVKNAPSGNINRS